MKTFVVVALTFFFALPSYSQVPPTPDPYLFAHWKFDSILDDWTYNGNHLAHMNGFWNPVYYRPGRDSTPNKAIQLGQYACKVITYFPSYDDKPLQVDSGYNSWSVASWITSGAGYLVGNRNLKTLDDTIILFHRGQFSIGTTLDKRIKVTLIDVNGNLKVYETDTIYNRQKWNHLVCVFDKDKDSLNIYLNAQKIYTDKLVPMQQEKALMCVGGMYQFDTLTLNGWGGSTWRFIEMFYGKVDDLRIYKKKLNDTDVMQLYLNDYVSGIEKIHTKSFSGKIYPNPANEYLTIESTEPLLSLKLYSVFGEELFTQTVNSDKARINFKNLIAGSYMLMLSTAKEIYFEKIIKE